MGRKIIQTELRHGNLPTFGSFLTVVPCVTASGNGIKLHYHYRLKWQKQTKKKTLKLGNMKEIAENIIAI